jgi:alpha-glucosidase
MRRILNTALWASLAASATAATVDDCPGYTLSNLVQSQSSWTADLTLSGDACNVYGEDINDLKLLVEYQTGAYYAKKGLTHANANANA